MIDWQRKAKVPAPNDNTLVLTFPPKYKETEGMYYRIMAGCHVKLHTEITHWAYHDPGATSIEEEKEECMTPEEWKGAQETTIKDQWSSIKKEMENDR